MIFGDTFIKSAKVHIFSAVVDLTLEKSQKDAFYSFLPQKMVFFTNFRSSHIFLFCSKQKVWIFSEILSPFPALYDKISLLWLLAKFAKKSNFHIFNEILKMHQIRPKLISSKTLRATTEARIRRMTLGRGSKFQEKSILFVWNKIKFFR